MINLLSRRSGLGVLCASAVLALAAGGCGSKSSSSSGSSGSSKAASGGSSSSASASTGGRSCPTGDTLATINGKSKCLHSGQICSHKAAALAAYPKYGFTCTQVGGSYRLKKG